MAVTGQFHFSAAYVNENLQYPLSGRLRCSESGDRRISASVENRNQTVQTTVTDFSDLVFRTLFCVIQIKI